MRLFTFCALALALVACESASDADTAFGAADSEPMELIEIDPTSTAPGRPSHPELAQLQRNATLPPTRTVQDTTAQRAPILLRSADVEYRVDDFEGATAAVPEIVGRFDAYLAGEREARRRSKIEAQFTIRVAASEFDSLMMALAELADVVERRTVTVQDVTEEYVDVEARLRARRAVEAQYVALLGRASSVEDVVAVQEQLAEVREEIESAEGRLRFLRNRATFSTIELTLYEPSAVGGLVGPGLLSRLGDAFGQGWQALLMGVVGVVVLWPAWVFFALVWLGWRAWRRRHPDAFRSRSARRQAPAAPTDD